MTKEEPLDEALNQIKNIVRLIEANLLTLVSQKDVKEMERVIGHIEKSMEEYQRNSLLEEGPLWISAEQRAMLSAGEIPAGVSGEYREALEMMIKLKKKIEELRENAHQQQGLFEAVGEGHQTAPLKEQTPSLSKHSRKKKFRRMGGNERGKV